MAPAVLGEILGALLITFLTNRACHHLLRNVASPLKRALLVAGATTALCVGLASIGMGFEEAITTYPPPIIIWLLADILGIRVLGGRSAPPKGAPRHSRLSEGFRRLSLVVGIAAGLLMGTGWVVNLSNDPGSRALLSQPLFWAACAGVSVVTGLLAYGAVRLVGWVLAGFLGASRN
jgi:hypothetical protein